MTDKLRESLTNNPTAASIEKLIGTELLEKLSKDFGGRRIYIPSEPGPHSPVVISIGMDAAKKLAQIWGSTNYAVPIALGKRAKINALHKKGMTAASIGQEVGRTERRVYQILAEGEDYRPSRDLNQLDMFKKD